MSAVVRVRYPFSFRSSSRSLLLLLLLFLGSSDVVLSNDVVLSSLEYELMRLVFFSPMEMESLECSDQTASEYHVRSRLFMNLAS